MRSSAAARIRHGVGDCFVAVAIVRPERRSMMKAIVISHVPGVVATAAIVDGARAGSV
jgi:hypothetical protein